MTMPQNQPQPAAARPTGTLERFFGGKPLAVLFKLVLLSILVGFVLKVLGLDPFNIIRSIRELVEYVWDMGFDAIVSLGRYFLLGAVLVIPIWLIVRLLPTPPAP